MKSASSAGSAGFTPNFLFYTFLFLNFIFLIIISEKTFFGVKPALPALILFITFFIIY
jgi:hypothetical protein